MIVKWLTCTFHGRRSPASFRIPRISPGEQSGWVCTTKQNLDGRRQEDLLESWNERSELCAIGRTREQSPPIDLLRRPSLGRSCGAKGRQYRRLECSSSLKRFLYVWDKIFDQKLVFYAKDMGNSIRSHLTHRLSSGWAGPQSTLLRLRSDWWRDVRFQRPVHLLSSDQKFPAPKRSK